MDDLYFMDQALELARQAAAEGEVPVGCVIVRKGEIVGRGRNRRETDKSALAHAEIEAIREACANLGGWRLWECDLYVTLEPCPALPTKSAALSALFAVCSPWSLTIIPRWNPAFGKRNVPRC